jgi:hypothetical protein
VSGSRFREKEDLFVEKRSLLTTECHKFPDTSLFFNSWGLRSPLSELSEQGRLTKATLQSSMASYDRSINELWRHWR